MKKSMLAFLLLLSVIVPAKADITVRENGTYYGSGIGLDVQGAAVSKSEGYVVVDATDITGDLEVDGSLYTDDSIYFTGLTTSDPGQTGSLYIAVGGTLMVSGY